MKYSVIILIVFLILFLSCEKKSTLEPINRQITVDESKSAQPVNNIVEFNELSVKPKVIKRVMPEYPEDARKAGYEGMVMIEIIINEEGKVVWAKILKNSEFPSLDGSAIVASKKFEFEPAKKDGKPVKVKMVVPFNFRLK